MQSKLLPVLDKYNVKLGLECPFHPDRDLYAPQQTAKQQDRPSQWTCTLCGKSFYEEKFLELHFEHRHPERINAAEDAVCLSNYCDVMRCDVLAAFEGTLFGARATSTDIEVWNERTAVVASAARAGRTKTGKSGNAETTRTSGSSSLNNKSQSSKEEASSSSATKCDRSRRTRRNLNDKDDVDDEEEDEDDDENNSSDGRESQCGTTIVDDVEEPAPPLDKKQQRIVEMQRMKANCKKEELEKLRAKCQTLIRDCIGGLLINLSTQEFKEMEGEEIIRILLNNLIILTYCDFSSDELNRKICWYLNCDRYWEDGVPERRAFPWILLVVAATILSFGICLCYYIIWVLFE